MANRDAISSSSFGKDASRLITFGQAKSRPPKNLVRPPGSRSFAAKPVGPREFQSRINPALADAPNAPPPGFIIASTSGSEWFVYWAFAKIYNDPRGDDVRKPPFYGSRDGTSWTYQYGYGGGGGPSLGKAKVDFVADMYGSPVLIRVQTEHFHVFTTPEKHFYDEMQKANIEKYGRVVDLYDQWFLGDPSGQACIVQCKRAIKGMEPVDPLLSGLATRVSIPSPGGRGA